MRQKVGAAIRVSFHRDDSMAFHMSSNDIATITVAMGALGIHIDRHPPQDPFDVVKKRALR